MERLKRAAAAAYLKQRWSLDVSRSLLSRMASEGGGPPYRQPGRAALYDKADLDAWAQERLSRKATTARAHRSLAAEAAAGPA